MLDANVKFTALFLSLIIFVTKHYYIQLSTLLHTTFYIITYNLLSVSAVCSSEGNKAVDVSNMCWYHECVLGEFGLLFLARQCAGMSKVSYNFVQGEHNPCTVNYEADDGKGNISHSKHSQPSFYIHRENDSLGFQVLRFENEFNTMYVII